MRVPLSWLAEYTEPSTPLTAESLHDALVSVGLEEEDVHTFDVTGPVVVGQVESFVDEPQSNGKTIRWCQVRVANKMRQDAPAVRGLSAVRTIFSKATKSWSPFPAPCCRVASRSRPGKPTATSQTA
jgi:hypothetical protein